MNQKKGAMPIILLLLFCLLTTLWVWKNVPQQSSADVAGLELTEFDLESLVAEGKPMMLNLSSDDCPYCVMMEPELAKVYLQYSGVATVHDINVDRTPQALEQLPMRATPTQVLFNADGTPYMPSEVMQQQLNFVQVIDQNTQEVLFTLHEGMLNAELMALILEDMGVSV